MSELLQTLQSYIYPLFRLMAELPDADTPWPEILAAFETTYSDRIPAEQREPSRPGADPRWHFSLASARWRLIEQRFVVGVDPTGWRLTASGRQWLADHPETTAWPPRPSAPAPSDRSNPSALPSSASPPSQIAPPASGNGVSLAQLEQTRVGMDPAEFRRVWGASYDQARAEEQTLPTRDIPDAELLAAARAPLHRIQSYLRGQGGEQPSGEVLCDWILVVYALGLYREAVHLWPYVNPEHVHDWYYRRTEKIVQACRARLGR